MFSQVQRRRRHKKTTTMATHPQGVVLTLHGLFAGDSTRSCETHDYCGEALYIDAVVRLRKLQIETGKLKNVKFANHKNTHPCRICLRTRSIRCCYCRLPHH